MNEGGRHEVPVTRARNKAIRQISARQEQSQEPGIESQARK